MRADARDASLLSYADLPFCLWSGSRDATPDRNGAHCMNGHELPSTLAVASEDVAMGIIYVLCAIILVAPIVMFVVGLWLEIRNWRRTSAGESTPTRPGGSEPAAVRGGTRRPSVHR